SDVDRMSVVEDHRSRRWRMPLVQQHCPSSDEHRCLGRRDGTADEETINVFLIEESSKLFYLPSVGAASGDQERDAHRISVLLDGFGDPGPHWIAELWNDQTDQPRTGFSEVLSP